jgi:immune inhibitor A
MSSKLLRLVLLVALAALVVVPIAAAALVSSSGTADTAANGTKTAKNDNRQITLDVKKAALLQNALQAKLKGTAYGKVAEVARGQYVQLAREGQGTIWTVLGEFADLQHNTLPEQDRSVDNSAIWVPDFGRDYYMDLLFNDAKGANSMRNYYIEQSSGRYAVNGDVTDWVHIPGNAVDYADPGQPGLGLPRRLDRRLVRGSDRGGQDSGPDRRVPEPVRCRRSLRLRR